MTVEKKKNFLINILFFAVVFAIAYFCFRFLTVFLLPFLVGLIISFISQRPVDAISRKLHISRNIVAVIFVVVVYLLVVSILAAIGYGVYTPIKNLLDNSSSYVQVATDFFSNLNTKIADMLHRETFDFSEYISISDLLKNVSGHLTKFLGSLVSSAPAFLVSIIVTIVASCYIAKDYTKIMAFAKRHMPKSISNGLHLAKYELFNNIFKILRGYIIIMFITFCELSIGLAIFGIKHFVAVAAIISVVDIMPVLGVGTVLIPWALILLLTGNPLGAVGIALMYLVITIIRNFIEPRIIGKQMGLHPLLTLICMFVGLRLFGILGMFGIPIAVMIIFNLQKSGKVDFVSYLKNALTA